jgi:hypothetical protein
MDTYKYEILFDNLFILNDEIDDSKFKVLFSNLNNFSNYRLNLKATLRREAKDILMTEASKISDIKVRDEIIQKIDVSYDVEHLINVSRKMIVLLKPTELPNTANNTVNNGINNRGNVPVNNPGNNRRNIPGNNRGNNSGNNRVKTKVKGILKTPSRQHATSKILIERVQRSVKKRTNSLRPAMNKSLKSKSNTFKKSFENVYNIYLIKYIRRETTKK